MTRAPIHQRRFLLLLAWLTGLTVCGCGAPAPHSTAQPTGEAGGLTVVDATGGRVTFAQLPRRIVIAGTSTLPVVETLYLFPAAAERLVGVGVGRQDPGDFLRLVDPRFHEKAMMKAPAGPEQIAAVKPDVVVMKTTNAEQLDRPLQQLGIAVIHVDLETPEQFQRDVATFGELLGDRARARQIQSFYQRKMEAVRDSLSGLTDQDRPYTLVVQYVERGGELAISVPSASWLQTIEVELAGGVAVWKEAATGGGWNVVNLEQVAAWNPDKVFVVDYAADPRQAVARLREDPLWQTLRSVKEGQIYGFGGDIFPWDQPDPRWILGLTWLATKLHPDRFPDLDMRQEVVEFFTSMYGMEEAAIQAHILPNLTGDVD